MKLHITQCINGNELSTDGDRGNIVITGHKAKKTNCWVADKAVEYWLEGGDGTEDEMQEDMPLREAIMHLVRFVPRSSEHVDGKFSVYDRETGELMVLAWHEMIDGKKTGCCLDLI